VQSLLRGAMEQELERERHRNQVQDKNILQEMTPWLRRTRWVKRFQGKDMKILNELCIEPTLGTEDGLDKVWKSVARVVARCFESVKDCSEREWNLILFWLASAHKKEPNNTPFSIYMDCKTKERYTRYWQQFIVFVVRGIDNEVEYGIQYTEPQSRAVNRIKDCLKQEEYNDKTLDMLVMNMSLEFIKHDCYGKERSALLYYTGVIGYHIGWKRWRAPEDYTPILAGLQ
jgi:hypothetical protein